MLYRFHLLEIIFKKNNSAPPLFLNAQKVCLKTIIINIYGGKQLYRTGWLLTCVLIIRATRAIRHRFFLVLHRGDFYTANGGYGNRQT